MSDINSNNQTNLNIEPNDSKINSGLTGQYDFKTNEKEVLKYWEENGLYESATLPSRKGNIEFVDSSQSTPSSAPLQVEEFKRDDYWTLVCPPPNAYDRPHMGNLSGYTYMDMMARYQRMRGKKVIMLPGKDHAGLEGEAVFIRDQLTPQGKKKSDFTREEFYDLLYKQQQEFIRYIQQDEKLTGLSADFSKDLYTLDPKVVEKVLQTFVDAYNKGLIYKGTRIVNWDPVAQSAVSDSQCEREERDGKLYYIKYELVEEEKNIYITRHGQTSDNTNKILSKYDVELTAQGISDARLLGEKLRNNGFELIISSDLVRTKQTARILSEMLGGLEIVETNLLREQNFGSWEGKLISEFEKYYGTLDLTWDEYLECDFHDGKGVEPGKKVMEKLKTFLKDYGKVLNNKKVLIVSHQATIKALQKLLYGNCDNEYISNTEVYCLKNNLFTESNNPSDIKIRKATYEDGKDVFHISVEGFEDNFVDESIGVTLDVIHDKLGMRFDNEEKIKEYSEMNVDPKHDFYVAEIDGHVVGWVSCEFMNELYWVDIYVKRGFRNQGIGQKLLNHILDKHQDKLLRLSVPQKSKAVEFYKRNGFIEYSRNKTADLENPKYPMMIEMRWTKKPYIEVATTRPETIFADTAVAVHPDDPRYKHFIGRKVKLPGLNREVPIITSKRVEMDFGTGCLKITPAHAQDDYTIMEEWNKEIEEAYPEAPFEKGGQGGFEKGWSGFLSFNSKLKELARKNRDHHNATKQENHLWYDFLSPLKKEKGIIFLRQKPIGNFIADFYCSKYNLVVEVDGESHVGKEAEEYDKLRTKYLNSLGITVLRFWNNEIDSDFESVCKKILETCINPLGFTVSPLKKGTKENKIGYINCIDKYAQLIGPVPEKYLGKKAKVVKEEFVTELAELGLLTKTEDIKQNILKSERTGAVIEQIISSQWFIKVDNLKEELKGLIEPSNLPSSTLSNPPSLSGGQTKLTLHPHDAQNRLFAWIDNLKDWAISRSLWWGYRLPVWYKGEKVETIDENGQVQLKLRVKSEILDERVILVDGFRTTILGSEETNQYFINKPLCDYLNKLPNRKILVTNASGEKLEIFKNLLKDFNFEIYSLENNPNKTNSEYFKKLFEDKKLDTSEIIYIDGRQDNLNSATATGIRPENTYLYSEGDEKVFNWIDENGQVQLKLKVKNKTFKKNIELPSEESILKQTYLELLETYEMLIDEFMNLLSRNDINSRFGKWSELELLKHLVGWSELRLYELKLYEEKKSIPIIEDFDLYNKTSIKKQELDSFNITRQKLISSYKLLLSEFRKYSNVNHEIKDIKLSNGKSKSIKDWLIIECSHNAGHLREILANQSEYILVDLDFSNRDLVRIQIENPGSDWHQDEEVLDTWFSSGQWPYLQLSTWDMMELYPIDCLVSGGDLLIKWDLIMMIMSLIKGLGTPFKNLYLTGLVLGKDGNKMSKSKKNGIPIESVVENYGIDSFRMNCIFKVAPFSNYQITEQTLKSFRNFNNKIWNAAKFVNEFCKVSTNEQITELHNPEDLEMKSKLEELKKHYIEMMDNYKFWIISEELYLSFWNEFCDKYIEIVKKRVGNYDKERGEYIKYTTQDANEARSNINYIFKEYLKMLHPFVPFVTERIWRELGEKEMLVRNII